MKHTFKETLDNEIDSYLPFGRGTTGFYVIRFDDPYADDDIEIRAWDSEFDDNPRLIEKDEYDALPADGWMHVDDCTCKECDEVE